MFLPVNNNFADIKPFMDLVLGAYQQSDAGMFPETLKRSLDEETNTLVEGLGICYRDLMRRKHKEENNAEWQSEVECYMDGTRRCVDKIPGFKDKLKEEIGENTFEKEGY